MRSHSQDLRPSMQRRMWMNAEHPWETQSLVTIIATTTWAATTAPAEWATFCTRTSIPAQSRASNLPRSSLPTPVSQTPVNTCPHDSALSGWSGCQHPFTFPRQ
ncbi:mannan-binding lectin serine peptidase 2, isoform CRA_c [Rattus norvegicus]|uniref:Mannan-binding lectin serine peptidase 2, isoform CRA_c n=1 Tax=Rattus norvegicus TaxID=10116 RepID=A6IU77_RAT|nr:mannan-binding lectin serine peptidase 2, isoform CRA_c [Rattus norvegicus]